MKPIGQFHDSSYPEINETPFSEWSADWLLSDPTDDNWRIRTDKKKYKSISFNDALPDGRRLSDPTLRLVSDTIKKITFLVRTGAYAEKTTDPLVTRYNHQYAIARSLKILVKFAISENIEISTLGFGGLTKLDFDRFNARAVYGAEHLDGRIQSARQFLDFQQNNGSLNNYIKKDGSVDFKKLFDKLTHKGDYLKSHRAIYSLRDFRSKPLEYYAFNSRAGELTDTTAIQYEKAAQKLISESTLASFHLSWKKLGKFSHVLPELQGLEWASDFQTNEIAKRLGVQGKARTRTIPVSTAMEYLNHSIRFIVEFGSDIVSMKNHCDKLLYEKLTNNKARKDHFCLKITVPPSKTTTELNIKRYNRNATNRSMDFKRKNLSVEEACDCLIASAYIIIGTFACKRIDEVLSLDEDCIRPALDGGWELFFGLEKSSPIELLTSIGRPVPELVRKAVDLLIDLTPTHLRESSSKEAVPLFKSSVDVSNSNKVIREMSEDTLNNLLTQFADFVQITPDTQSFPEPRRWYLRTHQLRRFFAITYFWHNSFTDLPALAWFMGHVDIETTIRYITEDIEGAEISEEQARFAASIMSEEVQGYQLPEVEEKVKKHFKIETLDMISKHQLEHYLKEVFLSGASITKHYSNDDELVFLEAEYG